MGRGGGGILPGSAGAHVDRSSSFTVGIGLARDARPAQNRQRRRHDRTPATNGNWQLPLSCGQFRKARAVTTQVSWTSGVQHVNWR